jgi:hypothetical protein
LNVFLNATRDSTSATSFVQWYLSCNGTIGERGTMVS